MGWLRARNHVFLTTKEKMKPCTMMLSLLMMIRFALQNLSSKIPLQEYHMHKWKKDTSSPFIAHLAFTIHCARCNLICTWTYSTKIQPPAPQVSSSKNKPRKCQRRLKENATIG